MSCKANSLPSEPSELQALCARQATEIAYLKEQVALLTAQRFARRSERFNPNQGQLFNEAEVVVPEVREVENTLEVPAHQRQRPGRKPLPTQLPRVDIIHELPESAQHCEHDGQALVVIGEEISEQLDIIPAQIRVLRHIRKKYACPHCQLGVKTAPLPPQPLPKTMASPGLLAHIVTSKYQDGLPLHRQEQIFQRMGIDLPRSTQAAWMMKLGGELLQPLMNLLRDELLGYDIIQMDETPVQVLKEPDKPPTSNSYVWVQRGGPPGKPVILFDYDPSRGQSVPLRLLEGYQGYLQVDGYIGYEAIGQTPGLVLLGCFAHARRKFDESLKGQAKAKQPDTAVRVSHARHVMQVIQSLYRIERDAKDATPEVRYQQRQTLAKPILDELRLWLDTALPTVPPQSLTGKALLYLNSQWPKLIRYLEDGRLSLDNNKTENAIRPFVIGRKYDKPIIMQSSIPYCLS